MNQTLIDACIKARTMIESQPVPRQISGGLPLQPGVEGNRVLLAQASLRLSYLAAISKAANDHRKYAAKIEQQRLRACEFRSKLVNRVIRIRAGM